MAEKRLLAFDFGASGGRAMLGRFDGQGIQMQEAHRFSNDPVTLGGTMYWDVLRLFFEMKQGLSKARALGGFDSIGIDTWGVDFGLLDGRGNLVENPVHYRDGRTAGMLNEALRRIDKERFYRITGNQFMEINTAFQLLSLAQNRPELLERAERLLLMPDLFNYFFTGEMLTERSIASTTQLMDAQKGVWSGEVLAALGVPARLLGEIRPSGTPVGPLSPALQAELGLPAARVVAVAGHDTQAAMAAVPAAEKDFAFLSCGTWSLLGTELDAPCISEASYACNLTNESGVEGKTSLLKNIIGLWLIQETRRQWRREGREVSFAQMEEMARAAAPFGRFIDPDDPLFTPAGDIPGRIGEYCRRTGQRPPETEGETLRCIYESLALKYRLALAQLERCTGKAYPVLYLVGGGARDKLLCQMTANALGRPVCAGPVEATVLGNLAIQLMAAGEIKDLAQARALVRASGPPAWYEPEEAALWSEAAGRYEEMIGC